MFATYYLVLFILVLISEWFCDKNEKSLRNCLNFDVIIVKFLINLTFIEFCKYKFKLQSTYLKTKVNINS